MASVRPPALRSRLPLQRGLVTAVVMLFLISTVVFSLGLMLLNSGSNVADGQRQADSTAAFFLAESGLDTAQAGISNGLIGSYTNLTCTGLTGTLNLGRGSVVTSAVSEPASCDNGGATPCTKCTVTATGSVGAAVRTVTQEMALTVRNGTFCNGANNDCSNNPTVTWKLNLKNLSGTTGVGVFNLTYIGQGANTPTCALGSNCRLEQNLSSPSNGQNSTGLMGNAVLIPGGSTYPIYQTMTKGGNNVVEVGAFFLGSTAPSLTGPDALTGSAAFWDDNKNSSTNTVGASGATTGATNDGSFSPTASCSRPSAHSQSCNSWCYGGDTLVYSFAGNVTALTDALTGVTFGSGAQSMALSRVAKYPTNLITGSPPVNLDAEIWYARNANFVGATPYTTNASSYKGRGSGVIGATWTSNNTDGTKIAGTTLTVGASFGTAGSQIISVGDAVSNSGGGGSAPSCATNCGTVVAQLTSTETGGTLGGKGTYQLSVSNTVNSANNRVWTIKSNVLHVTDCTICDFENGDALSGLVSGRTINGAQAALNNNYGITEASGGFGRYPISGLPVQVALGANLYAGTPGNTLYLASSANQPPAATLLPMMIKLTAGTGALAAGTKVTATSSPNAVTKAMTLSATPTTALDGATLCGGICALFVTNGTTPFSLSGITVNFNEWASGFMCLKGVDITPVPVTSSTSAAGRWTEQVQ